MSSVRRRKCRHCGKLYEPDRRNRRHQRYCSEAECRKASKQKSQRHWANKPENQGYFCGAPHVERVRQWRREHPGYWRKKGTKEAVALQDDCVTQVSKNIEEPGKLVSFALQDVISSQHFVLVGLIAQLTGVTLQDEIASSTRRLISLGQDILTGGAKVGSEASAMSQSPTASAEAIQLGRSSPGP